MHVQHRLENDSETSEIKYLRKETHKDKDGHVTANLCDLSTITNNKIVEAVNKAKEDAQRTIEAVGMHDLMKKKTILRNLTQVRIAMMMMMIMIIVVMMIMKTKRNKKVS